MDNPQLSKFNERIGVKILGLAAGVTGAVNTNVALFTGLNLNIGGPILLPRWLTRTDDADLGTLLRLVERGNYFIKVCLRCVGVANLRAGIMMDSVVGGAFDFASSQIWDYGEYDGPAAPSVGTITLGNEVFVSQAEVNAGGRNVRVGFVTGGGLAPPAANVTLTVCGIMISRLADQQG